MLSQKLLLTNEKVHLTLVCSLTDCWGGFFPYLWSQNIKTILMSLRHDLVRVWAILTPAVPIIRQAVSKAQLLVVECAFIHTKETMSLTPFSTASVKAGIKTLAFLMTESLILPGLTDLCYPTEIRARREWVVQKTFSTLWFCQGLVLPL